MPRDEFERLERRWRKQPLFLRRRSPRWPLVMLVAGLAAVFVWQQPTAGLIERVQRALVAGREVAPAPPQASAESGGAGTADAGVTQAPGIQGAEPRGDR